MDIASIYLYNATTYGDAHADQYIAFLNDSVDLLTESVGLGSPVEGFDSVRVVLVKSRARRQAHGYRVFYREVDSGIEIIRILHTNFPLDAVLDEAEKKED